MALTRLLALCAAVRPFADWGFAEENDVIALTPETHEPLLRAFEEVLVYYHLPDCAHCVNLDDAFSQLALAYKEGDRRLPMAKLDCRRHLAFCRQHGIPSFPFFKLFVRAHPLVYYGERSRAGLRGFIDAALARAPVALRLEELPGALRGVRELAAVFVGRRAKRGYHLLDLMSRFDQRADFFQLEAAPELAQHALFRALDEPELEGRHVLFRAGAAHLCPPATTFELLEQCIAELRHPAVLELGAAVTRMIGEAPQRWMILFARDGGQTAEFARFAQSNRHAMKFVLAAESGADAALLQRFRRALLVDDAQPLPQVRLFDTALTLEGAVRYRFEGAVSYSALRAFHRKVLDKAVEPAFRSEEFDARALGALTAISARSFPARVLAGGRDAVVLYHGELEGDAASREMLAALEPLSAEAANAGVAFFALNADRNDLSLFHSAQRPLLLLFGRRDPTHPRVYAGPAQPARLQAFVDTRRTLTKEAPLSALSDEF